MTSYLMGTELLRVIKKKSWVHIVLIHKIVKLMPLNCRCITGKLVHLTQA